MFEVFKHVEAGTGRCKQDDISGRSVLLSHAHCVLERAGANRCNRLSNRLFDLFGCFADENYKGGTPLELRHQSSEVSCLVESAHDYDDGSIKKLKSTKCGIDVGGFGIIVVVNPAKTANPFEPMFNARESAERFSDRIQWCLNQIADRYGCQCIL